LKGEALSVLGRYDEAIAIFDRVLAANPKDAETLNSRGIARVALGRLADANDDWSRQFELLPPTSSAARACLAMRQGNHAAAFHEFGLACAKAPGNLYWQLYRQTAARLAGVPAEPCIVEDGVVEDDGQWPAMLLAYQAGKVTEEALLCQANSPGRHAEVRFQMAVLTSGGNPAAARRHWREVVDQGPPALIEYAAASNELARLGS
jgi:tetratricopeptide (TPR) repeat protein